MKQIYKVGCETSEGWQEHDTYRKLYHYEAAVRDLVAGNRALCLKGATTYANKVRLQTIEITETVVDEAITTI